VLPGDRGRCCSPQYSPGCAHRSCAACGGATSTSRKVLHVRQRADRYAVIGKPKSKASHRTVPLGPTVVNALREWKPSSKLACPKGEHGLVFPTPSGAIALHNDVVRAFIVAVRALGLTGANGQPKYTGLHALRHFYASWCINPIELGGQGVSKIVQQLLGHSSIVMTMDTYGHLFPTDKTHTSDWPRLNARC